MHVCLDFFDQMDPRDEIEEITALANTAGANVIGTLSVTRARPNARFFIGTGKVAEISAQVKADEIDLLIFNHELMPSQERELEKVTQCRVLDRAGLILDIFASRARTHESKLQVELAQLAHIATRLVHGRTHLEHQKGGIGLRGPGETQLETDRRLLAVRIKQLEQKLEKVRKQRQNSREGRIKQERSMVAVVGYTNAGKSTLFNTLTSSSIYVADQLFATLNPTIRRLPLPDCRHALITDTVGFISNLPHELIASFRATLEETREASLLLHVVDASDENRDRRIEQVNQVLTEIGADETPQLLVYNKIDKLGLEPRVDRDELAGVANRVWVSAVTGEGLPALLDEVNYRLRQDQRQGWLKLSVDQGRLRALFYERARVLNEKVSQEGDLWIEVSIQKKTLDQLSAECDAPLKLGPEPEFLTSP